MSNEIPDDIMEMLPEFLQESEEHLHVLNEKMLEAETAVKNGSTMEQTDLNTMFRSAHTIKGTASFIGLKKVVALTHKAETLLQKLRDNELSLNEKIINTLFSAIDVLNSLLTSLRENKTEGVEIDGEVAKIEQILNPGTAPAGTPPLQSVTPPPAAVKPPEPPPSPPAPKPAPAEPSGDKEGISEKYLEQFINEIVGNIEEMDGLLMKAEQESQNAAVVNDIFRQTHTIKGSAGLVNAKEIADVAHKMENILHFFRSNNKALPPEMVTSLFHGLDALKAMVESLRKNRKIIYDPVPVCRELDKCSIKVVLEMKVGQAKTPVAKSEPKVHEVAIDWSTQLTSGQRSLVSGYVGKGFDVFLIEGVISARESIKSMRAAIVRERLNKNGEVVALFPVDQALDALTTDVMMSALFCSQINESNIREILKMDGFKVRTVEKADDQFVQSITGEKKMSQDVPVHAAVSPAPAMASAAVQTHEEHKPVAVAAAAGGAPIEISTIKIDSRKLDKLMNLSGELVIIRSQYARLAGLFNNDLIKQKELSRLAEHSQVLMENLEKESGPAAVSRDFGRIQKLVTEMKGTLTQMYNYLSAEDIVENVHTLSETTSSLEKTASDLQAGVMQTRMVPVEGVFTRFKRIVRDISKDLNKDVILKIEGAETELDKKIVDGLGDPLTHMIRNAVDHGLEDKETREKAGKSPTGTIVLKASHKGNNMCIEISDDGKGMDPAKIAEVAVRKGVISEDQAAKMTDKEKLNLIFLPGFSTAQKVTGLSGRGVGMDVVKNMITSFNGVVDIDTRLGQGSTFILKFPLTLAIIQALLVVIGDNVFAFPLDAVTEIFKVPVKDIYSVDGNATVKLRDHALSLISLEKVIEVAPNKVAENEDRRVVIITDGENRLGVLVDSLVGKDEIVIKSFTKHFSRVKGIIGASILADGNVALILDPATIIKESR